MKIVVTGALGHIGSRLIREMPIRFPDVEIVMIDDLTTQRYPSLFDLPRAGRYRFIGEDVRRLDLRETLEQHDVVVHLAARTEAAASFGHPEQVESNNLEATHGVAEACADTGARLVFLSSTSVYSPSGSHVSEDCPDSDLQPASPYAKTKLKEERLVRECVSAKGLRAILFRFGTIFGVSPGMRFHTAVNKFCWQAAMSQPVTVWRTAYDQKRPYLDLSDAVAAIGFAIDNALFDGRVYNAVTLNATVRTIIEAIRQTVPDLRVALVDSPAMNTLSFEVSRKRLEEQGLVFAGDLAAAVRQTLNALAQANRH